MSQNAQSRGTAVANRRREMSVRIVALTSDEAEDARMGGTVDERVAAVSALTAEAWRLAGRPVPSYDRVTMPVVRTTLASHRGSE
jgi:hypothetical protein